MKALLIQIVRFYQNTAPARVRNSCRFEPTCSEYMILSLQKHGTIKGFKKGINRLKRCRIPNEGIDYP